MFMSPLLDQGSDAGSPQQTCWRRSRRLSESLWVELNIRISELDVNKKTDKKTQDMGYFLSASGEEGDKKRLQWNKGNRRQNSKPP
jgi:hypothetical protein